MLFSFPSNCYLTVLISDKYDAELIASDILLVLTIVAGNLCNKCPKRLLEQNSSYSDYFNVVSMEQQSPRRPVDINDWEEKILLCFLTGTNFLNFIFFGKFGADRDI